MATGWRTSGSAATSFTAKPSAMVIFLGASVGEYPCAISSCAKRRMQQPRREARRNPGLIGVFSTAGQSGPWTGPGGRSVIVQGSRVSSQPWHGEQINSGETHHEAHDMDP